MDRGVVRVRAVPGLLTRDPLRDRLDHAIESLNARFRRARGHFPTERTAPKCLYLVVRSLDPKGTGQQRWMNRALNAFAITFEGRFFYTHTTDRQTSYANDRTDPTIGVDAATEKGISALLPGASGADDGFRAAGPE